MRNRILVLDEATASVDSATDEIPPEIIWQEFQEMHCDCHSVPTVVDSDMCPISWYASYFPLISNVAY